MKDKIIIAVDAMGGEGAPKKIIDGIILHLKKNNDVFYKIFGNKNEILNILPKDLMNNSLEIIHTDEKVLDNDSALEGAKKSKKTSMWMAVESVKNKDSDIVISAGNTGALFVISKLNLKMIDNIDKPALSGLWPNKYGMNVVLDLGANIECSEKNLIDFCIMGASLHKALFPDEKSKVALLNIGSEDIKGHELIRSAYQKINNIKDYDFEFSGYIEGNNIMNGDVNVIVTDGFTGNIALKTAEGTANFITKEIKKNMTSGIIGKILTMLNYKNLMRFKKRLDPRLYNGAIFIGLNSPVIKSHGSTDHVGFAHSLDVCKKIVKGDLINKIKSNINK
tara:strand:+ start:2407 stop:3414 length:1008 start_codon:yes stop_codon:yes gene_type:complete